MGSPNNFFCGPAPLTKCSKSNVYMPDALGNPILWSDRLDGPLLLASETGRLVVTWRWRRWMHESFVWLTAFSLDTAHLKIRRCRWAWCPLRIGVAVCIHDTEIVLRVLIQVFGSNPVTTGRRFPRERDIAFEYLVGVAADLYVGAVAVKSLNPVRQPRAVVVRVVAVVSAARAFVWSWSHDTCQIAVDTVGPLSGGSIPWPLSGGSGRFLPHSAIAPSPRAPSP
jgi:hypothetical protein